MTCTWCGVKRKEMKKTEKPGLDTLRKLKGAAKLQYIWDYYKLPLFLIFVFLYGAGYLIWRSATAENPQLYLAYVNLEVGETLDHNLTEGFLDYLQPAEKNSVIKTIRDLALTENLQEVDASYVHASQVKVLAAIDNRQLDVVLMNQEAFDAFSQNGLLFNLENFSKEHALTHLAPYFVENIEILSDNATEVLMDPSVTYQSETTAYPMGIEITSFPLIQEAGFPDHVYLGIIANTEHAGNAAAFVSYLAGNAGQGDQG